MTREEIEQAFPNLHGQFDMTSDPDEAYNCIAWAVNDTVNYWWPTEFRYPGIYWPLGVPRELTIAAFATLFEYLYFEACDARVFEEGYDKVALYADANGTPTHAARWWREDGGWSSKLGEENDIRHHNLESLESHDYGSVVRIFRRKRIEQRSV